MEEENSNLEPLLQNAARKEGKIMAKVAPTDDKIQEEVKDESDKVEQGDDDDDDDDGQTVVVEKSVAERKEEVVVAYVDEGNSGKIRSNAWQVSIIKFISPITLSLHTLLILRYVH